MLINELNANASSGCDLIEFCVTQGGLLRHVVKERTAVVYAFPEVVVATDDIVVLHFNRGNANCVQSNPAGQTPGYEAESTSQFAQAQIAANYDTAWDHWTTDSGLTATDNVISLLLDDTIVDAVLVSDAPTGTPQRLRERRTDGGGGEPVDDRGGSSTRGWICRRRLQRSRRQDLNGAGTRNGTNSIRRTGQTDRNHKGDWSFRASSFGRANQSAGSSRSLSKRMRSRSLQPLRTEALSRPPAASRGLESAPSPRGELVDATENLDQVHLVDVDAAFDPPPALAVLGDADPARRRSGACRARALDSALGGLRRDAVLDVESLLNLTPASRLLEHLCHRPASSYQRTRCAPLKVSRRPSDGLDQATRVAQDPSRSASKMATKPTSGSPNPHAAG